MTGTFDRAGIERRLVEMGEAMDREISRLRVVEEAAWEEVDPTHHALAATVAALTGGEE